LSEINADEAQAIREVVQGGRDQAKGLVSERNFSQPRHLSAHRLQHLTKVVGTTMQEIGNRMSAPLRSFHKLQVASLSEVNATGLFDACKAPFVILGLQIEGTLGWLVWEERAATATVEQILAGELAPDQVIEPRPLSTSESRVLESLLRIIVEPIGNSLGLKIKTDGIAQDEEGLKTLRDAGPEADARRLMVHLSFDGPGGPSDMRLYLPNIHEGDEAPKPKALRKVPGHLDSVRMVMRAELGHTQIPLRDLLSLEVGDVIPLGTEVGGPVHLFVEDRSIAQGSWGQVGGMLALKVTKIDTEGLGNE